MDVEWDRTGLLGAVERRRGERTVVEGELLCQVAGLTGWISRSRVQVLVGTTHCTTNRGAATAAVLLERR